MRGDFVLRFGSKDALWNLRDVVAQFLELRGSDSNLSEWAIDFHAELKKLIASGDDEPELYVPEDWGYGGGP